REVRAILLGEERRDGDVRSGRRRRGASNANGGTADIAMLDAHAESRGVVVVLEEHSVGGAALEIDGERLERLPADPGVVHADRRAIEAIVADTELHLGRMHDPGLDLLGGERTARSELRSEQGVQRGAGGRAKRVVRGENEAGGNLLE